MINGITSFLTSNTLSTIAQSTSSSVTIETTMKAIGRPGFILIDNNISPDTKKYAATKEFLYQATCLLVYAALVVPVFKHGAFKLGKKLLKNQTENFAKFKNLNEYTKYRKYAKLEFNDRKTNTKIDKELSPELAQYLHTHEDTPERYDTIKGCVELGSLIGSVLGLAILAPQVSHVIIHPTLRFLGMEDPKKKSENLSQTSDKKFDVKG